LLYWPSRADKACWPCHSGIYASCSLLCKKENTTTKVTQVTNKDGPVESVVLEAESNVTVEKDLVSQAEEEDIEALLSK